MTALMTLLLALAQPHPLTCNQMDFDGDGEVTTADYAIFTECITDEGQVQPTPVPSPTPTPTPTPSPSPTPTPTPTPSPSPGPTPAPIFRSTDDIQSAIDTAQPGAVITIPAGTYRWASSNYNEALTINKPLTLRGTGDVTLDCEAARGTAQTGHRRGIIVAADNVTIENITIRRAHREGVYVGSVSGTTLRAVTAIECGLNPSNGESAGIKLDGSKSFTVDNCAAYNCYAGIAAKRAHTGTIRHCWSQGSGKMANGTPIYPENADGICTSQATHGSDNVNVTSCGVVDAADDGIDLSHSRDCSVRHSFAIGGNSANLPNGDGNGFKVGNDANTDRTRHCWNLVIEDVYAISNRANGIDGRNGTGQTFRDCIAYGNMGQFAFSGGNITTPPKTFGTIYAIGNVAARDRNVVIQTDPGWRDPDAQIDATRQGDARATYRHVWEQLESNFEVR